jgi:hypothetical protein
MIKHHLSVLFSTLLLIGTNTSLFGQVIQTQSDTVRKNSANIFIDCVDCDQDYFHDQITFVNFVREPKDAHVHLLITSQTTGSGGAEYSLLFLGQKQFSGQKDTLICNTKQDATPDEIRQAQVKIIKLGLTRFVAKFPVAGLIDISYNAPQKQAIVEDKWRSWVFQVDFGGYASDEESYKSISLWSSLSAQKITPDWKIQFEAGNYYKEDHYIFPSSTIIAMNRENYFTHKAVKSINNHWSSGEGVSISTSDYSNSKLFFSIYPLIEYDLFPYDQSTRKQLRVMYGMGYEHADYIDTTIFNKISEGLFGQKLMVSFQMKQKWGSITLTARSFNYLKDFSLHNFRLQPEVSWRIFKGLSLTLSGTIAWLSDQIYLSKENYSYEDVLLKQKQLATSYYYYTNFGLTYSFGSIYNNIVNPRFGGYY